jgi:flagellar biosynthesis protein FliQ
MLMELALSAFWLLSAVVCVAFIGCLVVGVVKAFTEAGKKDK